MKAAVEKLDGEHVADDLGTHLCAMHAQWRKVLFWKGGARLLSLVLTALVLLCVVDATFHPPFSLRLTLAAAFYCAVLAVGWQTWLRYLTRPYSPEAMAWVLESVFPEFHEKLISAVEFSAARAASKGISEALIAETMKEARLDIAPLSPAAVFPMRWQVLRIPALFVLALATLSLVPPLELQRRLGRVALPSPYDPSVGTFRLTLDVGAPERDEGDTVVFRARGRGRHGGTVELVLQDPGERRFVMEPTATPGAFSYTLRGVQQSFTAWAVSGASRSEASSVKVRKRPRAESFVIRYQYPDYSGLQPKQVTALRGELTALRGTRAQVSVTCNQPLSRCEISLEGETIVADLDQSRRTAAFSVPVRHHGRYRISLINQAGLRNADDLTYAIKPIPDFPPTISLLLPSEDISLDEGESMTVAWQAVDDYGVAVQQVIFTNADGKELLSIDMTGKTEKIDLLPAELGLPTGVEMLLFVACRDDAQQGAASNSVTVFVGAGRELELAEKYLTSCRQLSLTLEQMADELTATATYAGYLESLEPDSGDDPHYRLMLDSKIDDITALLESAQGLTLAMKEQGTFPGNRHCTELLGLYQEQELLFSIPQLSGDNAKQSFDHLKKMVGLSRELCAVLEQKGTLNRALLRLPLKQQALKRMNAAGNRDLAVRKLSLVLTELARMFPGIEKRLPPADALDSADRSLDRVAEDILAVVADVELKKRTELADTREVERMADAIERELRGMEKALQLLAERLRRGGTHQQWQEAHSLAQTYSKIVARETDPVRRADAALVAEAMSAAARRRAAHQFEVVAEAIAAFKSLHRVESFARQLHRLRISAHDIEHTIRQGEPARVGMVGPGLEAVRKRVSGLSVEARSLRVVEKADILSAVTADLDKAAAHAEAAAAARRSLNGQSGGTLERMRDQASGMNTAIGAAVDHLDNLLTQQRMESEVLRRRLSEQAGSMAEKIVALANRIRREADLALGPLASFSDLTAALEEVDAIAANVSRTLHDQAARDLAVERTVPERIIEKIVLSMAIDRLRSSALERARNAVDEAAAGNDDGPALRASYNTVAESLYRGSSALAAISEMVRGNEQAGDGTSPPAEQRRLHNRVLQTYGGLVTDRVWRGLQDAGVFAIAARDLSMLVHEKGLNGADSLPGLQPSLEALVTLLCSWDPAAMEMIRRETIDRAQADVASLRSDIRRAKIERQHRPAAAGNSPLISSIEAKARQLGLSLVAADTANRITRAPYPPLAGIHGPQLTDCVAAAAKAMRTGAVGTEELDDLAHCLQRLDIQLQQMLDQQSLSEGCLLYTTEPEAVIPAGLRNELDHLEALLLEGIQTAAATASLRKQIQFARDLAAEAFAGVIADSSGDLARHLQAIHERFTQATDASRLAALNEAVESVQRQELAARFSEALEALSGDAQRMARTTDLLQLTEALGLQVVEATERVDEVMRHTWPRTRSYLDALFYGLQHNAKAGLFHSARRNLQAIEAALSASEQRPHPSVAHRIPLQQKAAPVLVRDALAGLDLNAAKGVVMELTEQYPDGTFSGSSQAIEAALTGNYDTAAMLASGAAARQFDRAARTRRQMAEQVIALPPRFTAPRDPVSTLQEMFFRAKAEEDPVELARMALDLTRDLGETPSAMQTKSGRGKLAELEAMRASLGAGVFAVSRMLRATANDEHERDQSEPRVEDIREALDIYQRQLAALIRDLQDARSVAGTASALTQLATRTKRLEGELILEYPQDELLDLVREAIKEPSLPPADRIILAESLQKTDTLSPMAAATELRRASGELSEISARLAERIKRAATPTLADPVLQERSAELNMQKAALAEGVRKLLETLVDRHSIPVLTAREALFEALVAMESGGWNAVVNRLTAARRAVEGLETVHVADVALNEAAFDGAAIARELRNRHALHLARMGDYGAAARSMEDLATTVKSQQLKQLALHGAQQFRQAIEEAREELPPDLRRALDSVLQAFAGWEGLPPALVKVANAVLAGDCRRASVELDRCLRNDSWRAKAELWELSSALASAHEVWTERRAELPPQAREVLDELINMRERSTLLSSALIGAAHRAARDSYFNLADKYLTVAAEAQPGSSFVPMIEKLKDAEAQAYAGVPLSARPAARSLEHGHAKLLGMLSEGRIAKALYSAAAAGESEPARWLNAAYDAAVRSLPDAVRHALARVRRMADQQDPLVDPVALIDAQDRILQHRYDQAAVALRAAADDLIEMAEVAGAIQKTAAEASELNQRLNDAKLFLSRGQLAGALDHACEVVQIPGVENAISEIREAAALREELAAGLFADALTSTDPHVQKQSRSAAQALTAGTLAEARRHLLQAGEQKRGALEQLAVMESRVNSAADALSQAAVAAAAEWTAHARDLSIRAEDAARIFVVGTAWPGDAFQAEAEKQRIGSEMMRAAEMLAEGDIAGAATVVESIPSGLVALAEIAEQLQSQVPPESANGTRLASAYGAVSDAGRSAAECALQLGLVLAPASMGNAASAIRADECLAAARGAIANAEMLSRSQSLQAVIALSAEGGAGSVGIQVQDDSAGKGLPPWSAARGYLQRRNSIGTSGRYPDYYRKANQAYLEQVAREGRRWAE